MISDMVDKKRTDQDGRKPVALMIVGYQGNKHLLSIFLSEIKERVVVVSSNNRLHGKVLYLNSTDLICPFTLRVWKLLSKVEKRDLVGLSPMCTQISSTLSSEWHREHLFLLNKLV